MEYLAFPIALGIVILFGYWSGHRRRMAQRKQRQDGRPNMKPKAESKFKTKSKLKTKSNSDRNTTLRRIK